MKYMNISTPPLLTLVVMFPATIKQALALYPGPVYLFFPGYSAITHIAAAAPTMANEQSISLRCLWYDLLFYLFEFSCFVYIDQRTDLLVEPNPNQGTRLHRLLYLRRLH